MEDIKPNKEEAYIQLMQLSNYDKTVTKCKIQVDRIIYYCGMYFHISMVNNGRREYIQEIGEQVYKRFQETRTFRITSATINLVTRNGMIRVDVNLAGSSSMDTMRKRNTLTVTELGRYMTMVIQATQDYPPNI